MWSGMRFVAFVYISYAQVFHIMLALNFSQDLTIKYKQTNKPENEIYVIPNIHLN